MSVLRYLLPTVAAAVAVSFSGFAQTPDMERDTEALKDYTKQKRSVSVSEKGGDLSLSGDVRFEYQNVAETADGTVQRGSGTGNANHQFDTEVNLMFDYRAEDTWASVKLEFDNNSGDTTTLSDNTTLGSGQESSIKLQRAFAGYNVFEEDTARFDLEVGRRKLYDLFVSKVQFGGTMDGVVLKYANSLEGVGDFYANGGSWIVDDRPDQFAWAVEAGLSDITDTGLYAKYSYIDWDNTGVDRWGNKPGDGDGNGWGRFWQSRNSQVMLGYRVQPEVLNVDVNFYSGYVVNHAAKKLIKTNNKKKNKAWFLGARLGKIEYAGDWSLDLNWQQVGAQAVLDHEAAGIGRGNTANNHFTDFGDGVAAETAKNGGANYKGYAIEGLFAVTDNWTFSMEYESSNAADKKIGGRNAYHKFEIETIYSF